MKRRNPPLDPRAPRSFLRAAALVLALAPVAAPAFSQSSLVLENGLLKAEFGDRGLTSLQDIATGARLRIGRDAWFVTVDGARLAAEDLKNVELKMEPSRLTFSSAASGWNVDLVYELKPGWRFITKQVVLSSPSRPAYHVDSVEALAAKISPIPANELPLNKGSFGALLRFATEPPAPSAAAPAASPSSARPSWSAFLLLQNPFLVWSRSGDEIRASYTPDMDWKREYGPFATDRLCLGIQGLSGTEFPAQAIPEWKFVPEYFRLLAESPLIDIAEVNALTDCVRAFLLWRPARSIRVHVPWCENDYQIDVATPDGAAEYKRILDRAAELGATHSLFTPANSAVSSLAENADSWGWENLLWFGLGQKIRRDEWNPKIDPVPPSIQAFLDYAAAKPLRLIAYAYPSLPFKQDPAWMKWTEGRTKGYDAVDTGIRSFQDWWLDKLLAFMRKTGAAGFSFDHWWIANDGATSKYAQWFGCRRVLESLRRQAPDAVVDGRQQYQNFGPWTWLAGSYPHPTLTDEQPESFTAFPDLSTDRVSADRQRFAAWKYRVERFCPSEIMPGYITHQTERSDAKGVMRRDRFRTRDWDVLGWKYSLLSSIATAPFNHVLDYIPARDPDEFKAFSDEDKAFFRRWLDWTDSFAEYMRQVRPIIGPPMIGRADGTAAIREDRGFVFLFNPNHARVEAPFRLAPTIGLVKGERFAVRELFPEEGRLIADGDAPFWRFGDEIVVPMGGCEARVLEISPAPAPEEFKEPLLFNAPGQAAWRANRLTLTGVAGEPGSEREILVVLPPGKRVLAMTVNGVRTPYKKRGDILTATVKFAGRPFGRAERVGTADGAFTGGAFKGSFRVPARVFKQLAARKAKWPVAYTEDDLLAPWLGAHRLLLYVQVAEPDAKMNVTATLDGKPLELRKAYNGIYGHYPERTFLGWYADASGVAPDADHALEVVLPALPAGRFQGVFFENVEPESTTSLAPVPAPAAKRPVPARRGHPVPTS